MDSTGRVGGSLPQLDSNSLQDRVIYLFQHKMRTLFCGISVLFHPDTALRSDTEYMTLAFAKNIFDFCLLVLLKNHTFAELKDMTSWALAELLQESWYELYKISNPDFKIRNTAA